MTQAELSKIINILNWHYVSRDDFAADRRAPAGKQLTHEKIDREYLRFFSEVKTIQQEQIALLQKLIKKHDLKAVYVEGLTEKNHKGTLKFIQTMKDYEASRKPSNNPIEAQHQLNLLEADTAARLVISGELKSLLLARIGLWWN